ncbi:MAG: DUF423 domain-containing protein [Polyangiales bacterium]
MSRGFVVLAGIFGLLAVAFGAFGAHGLEGMLGQLDDGAERAAWWDTATRYHLAHAVALGLVAWLCSRERGARAAAVAGWCFVAGVLLFSGSLYAMTLTGVRALGMVTPVGGLLLLAGWAAIIVSGCGQARNP